MANKVKTHNSDVLEIVKKISVTLHAAFVNSKMTMTKLQKDTGLSSNSLKTIFKGETANIASYIAVAKVLGLTLVLEDPMPKTKASVTSVKGDGSPTPTFQL